MLKKKFPLKKYIHSKVEWKKERIHTLPATISVENLSEENNELNFKSDYRSQNSSGEASSNSHFKEYDNSRLSFLQGNKGFAAMTAKKTTETRNDISRTTNLKRKNVRIKRQKSIKKRLFSANPKDETNTYATQSVATTFVHKISKFNKGNRASPLLPPIATNMKQTMYKPKSPVKEHIEQTGGTIRSGSTVKISKRTSKAKKIKGNKSRRMTEFSEGSSLNQTNTNHRNNSTDENQSQLQLQHKINKIRGVKGDLKPIVITNGMFGHQFQHDHILSPTTAKLHSSDLLPFG